MAARQARQESAAPPLQVAAGLLAQRVVEPSNLQKQDLSVVVRSPSRRAGDGSPVSGPVLVAVGVASAEALAQAETVRPAGAGRSLLESRRVRMAPASVAAWDWAQPAAARNADRGIRRPVAQRDPVSVAHDSRPDQRISAGRLHRGRATPEWLR